MKDREGVKKRRWLVGTSLRGVKKQVQKVAEALKQTRSISDVGGKREERPIFETRQAKLGDTGETREKHQR